MTWKPRPGWLLVEPLETEEVLPSGLIAPVQARDRLTRSQFTVLANGGVKDVDEDEEPTTPCHAVAGDWILAPPRCALVVDSEGVILLPESDVWGVIADVTPE